MTCPTDTPAVCPRCEGKGHTVRQSQSLDGEYLNYPCKRCTPAPSTPADPELAGMSVKELAYEYYKCMSAGHYVNAGIALQELERRTPPPAELRPVPEAVAAAKWVLEAHKFHEPRDCNFLVVARELVRLAGTAQ